MTLFFLTPAIGGMWSILALCLKPGIVLLSPLVSEPAFLWFLLFFLFLILSVFLFYKFLRLRKSIIRNSNKAVIKNGKSLNFYSLVELNDLLEKQQKEIQLQSEEIKKQSVHLQKIVEELEILSLVASKTDNVIIIMDGDGNFEWVNDGFVKRYGMNLDEFIHSRGKNLIQSSSHPEIDKIIKEIHATGKAYQYDSKINIHQNEDFWSHTTITPILDEMGKIIRLIAIDSDISKLKQAEEQINDQREELSKLNATKDKLFSIIAHDLKNPFHSIMGFSELLIHNMDSFEADKRKEFIQLIHESSASAYSLLENLLEWARTQTNRINFQPSMIAIPTLAREVFQIMNMHAKSKNIHLILKEDLNGRKVYADQNMIFTVIRNLVSNAIKFSNPGGEVIISIHESNGLLEFSVTDTGVGMSVEQKNKLFQLDQLQSAAGTSGETGTGLGLIVCHEFIKIHEGEIKVNSEAGKGSTFSFYLPFEANLPRL